MHVDAWVGFFDAGVGHVRKSVSDAKVASDIPINSSMTGELELRGDVHVSPLVPAQICGAAAEIELDRETPAAKLQARRQRTNESVIRVTADPTEVQVESRVDLESVKIPNPRQGKIGECLDLLQAVGDIVGGKAVTHASRFQCDRRKLTVLSDTTLPSHESEAEPKQRRWRASSG